MDRSQAKKVLALYRSDSPDAADPQIAEALEAAERDPELAAWFEQHRDTQAAIRAKFREIHVPPDLKRRILDAHVDHRKVIRLFGPMTLGLAAAAVIMISASFWLFYPATDNPFLRYREHMARSVQRRIYFKDMVNGDLTQIGNYFRTNGAPTDEALPANLLKLPIEGGTVVTWDNHRVSLLCLDGSDKGAAGKNDIWVFVAHSIDIPKGPDKKNPTFEKIGNFMTASWAADNSIYLIVGGDTQQDLQKYLE